MEFIFIVLGLLIGGLFRTSSGSKPAKDPPPTCFHCGEVTYGVLCSVCQAREDEAEKRRKEAVRESLALRDDQP